MHRFSYVMGNLSKRADLYRAIDLVMKSADQLPSTFRQAPPAAELLSGQGDASVRRVLNITQTLYVNASGRFPLNADGVSTALVALSEALASLSPGSCHALLRRLVLATLVRVQLRIHVPGMPRVDTELAAQLRFKPDTTMLMFRIYRLLYNKHRQGAAAKGAIEFLHISKSGGTSMCTVADANGCSAESTTNFGNCMVRRFDDRPRWVSATAHNETAALDGWRWYYRYLVRRGERTCEYRDEFMHRKRFTFYSNEFAAHGGLDGHSFLANGSSTGPVPPRSPPTWASAHVCRQFLNVIMLRHPLARLASHIKWIIKVYRTEYGKEHEAFFRGRDAEYWRRFAPAAVDNYYIRLLLGEGVYYAPIGSIGPTHLDAARLLLLSYDVVLLLESPDLDELWLKHALGWRVGLSSASARVAGSHRSTTELLPPDMDKLLAANDLDVQLYGFGSTLHELDGVMFAVMAAAGIQPYYSYDQLDPKDQWVGRRVKCGYVTRSKHLLEAMGEEVAAYERKYSAPFPRVLSPDERVRGGASEVAAALAAAGSGVQTGGGAVQAGQDHDDGERRRAVRRSVVEVERSEGQEEGRGDRSLGDGEG